MIWLADHLLRMIGYSYAYEKQQVEVSQLVVSQCGTFNCIYDRTANR
ncbi:hypothetical protein ACVLD2_004258 [Paenibacillus sp. PvR052]|nr:hypothetical protein [Paenibacillus sp. PvP091]MBP1170544.1 hypothetical protein [Paenibacillus sp. PvR098]MBP2441572.1 hypothetical protein [Paenibacillus sp. PvP052]